MPKEITILSAWQTALTQLDSVAKLMLLFGDIHQVLRNFDRTLTVSVPILKDGGFLRVFPGFWVQHNALIKAAYGITQN